MFPKILQNSMKNTSAGASFFKAAGLEPAPLLKKRLQHRFFSVNFASYLKPLTYRTPTKGYFWQ